MTFRQSKVHVAVVAVRLGVGPTYPERLGAALTAAAAPDVSTPL